MSKKEAAKKEKREKKPVEGAPETAPKKGERPKGPAEPSRLKVRYTKEIVPALMKHFSYANVNAVPKLEKIVVNMGLGEAIQNAKILDTAVDELGRITGQRATLDQHGARAPRLDEVPECARVEGVIVLRDLPGDLPLEPRGEARRDEPGATPDGTVAPVG